MTIQECRKLILKDRPLDKAELIEERGDLALFLVSPILPTYTGSAEILIDKKTGKHRPFSCVEDPDVAFATGVE